ncbi:MAG: MFS transporter [Alphaproteobacteria bacterium]|nr:MFS transporter [Alphaproteobacteria bacterium]
MNMFSPPTRLGLFYGAYFLAVGVMLPYWPVWLEGRGMSPEQIGAILAVTFWVKLIGHPTVSAVADATGRVRTTLTALAGMSVLVFLGFGLLDGFWVFVILAALAALCFQTIMPIGEALSLAVVKSGGYDYGKIRLWGSISFIVAASGMGPAIENLGTDIVWVALVACMVAILVSCRFLPEVRARTSKPWSWKAAGALALSPRFLLFVATAGAVQAGHAVYYAFGTIIWRDMGFQETAVGLLWTLGVVAEIVLFWFAGRLGRYGSAPVLLGIAIVGTLIRWPLTPFADTPWLAAPLQVLHALTFGAGHLGAMRFLQENAPEGLGATAQALYYALVSGVVMGTVMPLAGMLFQHQGSTTAYIAAGAMGLLAAAAFVPLFLLKPRSGSPLSG